MYCSKCGAQLPEGSKFCSDCGAPVPEAPPEPETGGTPLPKTAAAPEADSAPEPAAGRPAPQARNRKFLLLFLALCAVIAVVLVVRANLRNNKLFPVTVPNPEDFSGGILRELTIGEQDDCVTWAFDFPLDNFAMMEEYAALLEEYDFTLRQADVDPERESIVWIFDYTGPEEVELFSLGDTLDAAIVFHVYSGTRDNGEHHWHGFFMFSKSLKFKDTGERYSGKIADLNWKDDSGEADTSSGEADTSSGEVDASSGGTTTLTIPNEADASSGEGDPNAPKVPDFGAFAGGVSRRSDDTYGDLTQVSYYFEYENDLAEQYLALLLEDYDFKIRSSKIDEGSRRNLYLDYAGPVDGDFTTGATINDIAGLSVFFSYDTAPQSPEYDGRWVNVYYAASLDYADTGDRYSGPVGRGE